jgi:4-amino-4-deoxy-L-arabinose transferase-like glycosyltransferase
MKTWHLRKIGIIAAVLILLFSIGLRINAPRADIPSHLTFSGSTATDEGNQCHNSRSKALYGQWFPDDWRITNYNPVLPWIKYAVFKIFGVGLLQLRLVNYLFAGLSLVFFFLTLASYFHDNFKFALLGTLLLGINFLYVMYNKIGTFETSIIFWVILSLYFLEKYRRGKNRIFLILAGASTCMTFIFKSLMAYVFPLPFVAYILVYLFNTPDEEKLPIKQAVLNILFILLGILIFFVPWYLFHYLPNREWIISSPGQFMGNLIFPKSLAMAFNNFLTFPWKNQFYKIPIVWLSALLYIPLFFRRLLSREAKLTEIGYTVFFFAHTGVFFFMTYRPTRYLIPVIPAMVFMTTALFERWASASSAPGKPVSFGRLGKSTIFIVDFLWLSLAAYFCLIPLLDRYFFSIPRPRLSIYYFMASAILAAAVYLIKNLYRKYIGKPWNFKYLFIPLVVIMIMISVVIDMKYYWQWYSNRTYHAWDMAREVGQKLENAYIGGMTAPVAVLENRHHALWLYPNFVNWDEHTFDRYHLTHALLGTDISQEIIHFFNQWPGRMNHARLLRIYPLKDYFLHLYSFMEPYIDDCSREDGPNYRLKIVNPSTQIVETRIGVIYFFKEKPGEKSPGPGFQVLNGQQVFSLKPGENEAVIPVKESLYPNTNGLLFFLDYPTPFDFIPLRYEAENFPGRTGTNQVNSLASNQYVRYFNHKKNAPGFVAYGPAVPYAPGLLIADFHLAFDHLLTKIRPLCRLEIYSHEDKGAIAQRVIKPADITKTGPQTYRVYTLLPGAKKLEFRIYTEKWADVTFDYIDLTYYQGYVVFNKSGPIY